MFLGHTMTYYCIQKCVIVCFFLEEECAFSFFSVLILDYLFFSSLNQIKNQTVKIAHG